MPNLVITDACDLACSFCFASAYRADASAGAAARMSVDEVESLLRHLGVDQARFCGGEPTLHPEFTALLELALARRGGQVFLMTNGLWPGRVRDHIAALPARRSRRITYLVNVLAPDRYREGQHALLEATLQTLRPGAVTLSLTVDTPGFAFEQLLALAARHRIHHLRFSVAAPNLDQPRSWTLDPERDFGALAARLHTMVVQARAMGLRVHSDCGYLPPCAFTEAQRSALLDAVGPTAPRLEFRCRGPVDIGPGGEAWRCFGLYALLRVPWRELESGAALAEHLERHTAALERLDLLDACAGCGWRARGECGGGCYAFRALRALRARARTDGVAIDDDARLRQALPRVDAPRLRFGLQAGARVAMLSEHGVWSPLRPTPLEAWVLDACDGFRRVAALVAARAQLDGGPSVDQGVLRAVRRLYLRGAIALEP